MTKPPRRVRNSSSPFRSAQPHTSRRVSIPVPGRDRGWSLRAQPSLSIRQSSFPCTSSFSLDSYSHLQNLYCVGGPSPAFSGAYGTLCVFLCAPLCPLWFKILRKTEHLNSLCGPKLRASGPRVRSDLVITGRQWLFRQQLVLPQLRAFTHRIFHNAVFQRVKA